MNTREFYVNQYPVFFVSRVMGLAPFSVNFKAPSKDWVQLSVGWLIYSILIFCGYLYCFAVCVEISWRVPVERNYPLVSVIGHILQILLGLFIFNVCFILNFAKAKRTSRIGLAMSQVDEDLLKLAAPCRNLIDYKRSLRIKWTVLSLGVSFFTFMTIFDFFVFKDLYGNYMFVVCIAYIFPYFSACIMLWQFMNMIFMVKERLEVVNRFLQHIATANESSKSKKQADPVFTVDKEDSAAPKKKEFLKGSPDESFDCDLHLKLHDIFRVHDTLCELTEDINNGYSFQVVTCITAIFIFLIFGLFFEIKVVFWAWGGATKLVLISTSYLSWGIISTFEVYLLLYICTATRDTANNSALIIHKILQMKPVFMLNDETYYNKMKSFTLQVLHRKNILHFNGLGLFRLDYTFIFSAVSAATSYLIVLLQFDLTKELQAFSSAKFY